MANSKFVKSATALVLGASVLTSAVVVPGANASAKTTYKVTKKGTLVNAKTNKTVKGYKSYKGSLYNNGKKFTGVYSKRYYKNGVKATGTYKGAYYVKGVKKVTTGTYAGAYYVKGVKKVTTGTYSGAYYVKGVKKVTTGTYNKAYYVKGKKVVSTGLYENKYYKDGVLNVGLALFQDKLYKDADLANGVFEFNNDTNAYENGVVVPTSVASVSAVTESTITLSGAALGKVKAADVTVAGVSVASISPSADWKTATVTLNGTLPANKDVKASVKVGSETKDFTVNFAFNPKSVAVQAGTFDDDTNGQKLTVLVDGQVKTVDYLKASGYTVDFKAFDKDDKDATTAVFGVNTDGTLSSSKIAEGDYTVIVQIHKAGTILTSEKAKIQVKNLNNAATTVNDYVLYNNTLKAKQSSSTLFVGESADLKNITVGVGANKTVVDASNANVKVESSDKSVISVNPTTKALTANKIGTATIKVTVGNAVKEITLTVSGKQRYADSVEVKNTSVLSNTSNDQFIKVLVKDQYGDPVTNKNQAQTPASDTGFTLDGNTGIAGLTVKSWQAGSGASAASTYLETDADGYATVKVVATPGTTPAGKSGSVVIKDGSDVVTSFTLTTTDNDAEAKKEFGFAPESLSTDGSIDKELNGKDDSITYVVKSLNKDGVVLDKDVDLTGYKIKYDDKVVSVKATNATGAAIANDSTITGGVDKLYIGIVGKGTTDIVLTKGSETIKTTVTVATASSSLKAVNWIGGNTNLKFEKTGTINYSTVLDLNEGATGTDPAFKDGIITLSSPVLNTIRLHKVATNVNGATSPGVGTIYIDKDNDGKYSSGDAVIGSLTAAKSSDAQNINFGSNSAIDGATVAVGVATKGNITFSVLDTLGNFVAQKTVEVNVQGATLSNLTASAAKSATAGQTVVTGTKSAVSGTTLAYKNFATATPTTPVVGNALPSDATSTSSTFDAAANIGDKVAVYELDGANKVVGFAVVTIAASDIKPAAAPSAPVFAPGVATGTTSFTVPTGVEYSTNGTTWTAGAGAAVEIAATTSTTVKFRKPATTTQPASDEVSHAVLLTEIK